MPLRAKNGKWEYRFWIHGERVSKTTDLEATEPNRAKAERMERLHRDAILKGEEQARRAIPRGFIDASKEFMQHVEVEHSGKPNTVRRIETSLASLRVFFGNRTLSTIRTLDVERYKVWRLRGEDAARIAPVKPVTCRHDLHTLSKLFRWAKRMELCNDNPLADVTIPSDADAIRIHVLTANEEKRYFETALTRFTIEWEGRRQACGPFQDLYDVGRIILNQGMRPEEVTSLTKRQVDLEQRTLHVEFGKTKAARRKLRLTPESASILARRIARTDSTFVFPSPRVAGEPITKLNGAHNKVLLASGLEFVLYDLRHTFATRAAQAGMDLATLAAILGHSSLRMVMRYVHPTQSHMDAEMDRIAALPTIPLGQQPKTAKRRLM